MADLDQPGRVTNRQFAIPESARIVKVDGFYTYLLSQREMLIQELGRVEDLLIDAELLSGRSIVPHRERQADR